MTSFGKGRDTRQAKGFASRSYERQSPYAVLVMKDGNKKQFIEFFNSITAHPAAISTQL